MTTDMKCHYSLLSRGTERRRSRGHQRADGRFGYINIARSAEDFWIRPLPHGVSGSNEGALHCRAQSVTTVALARIQLVAASAFHSRAGEVPICAPALVVGSGPVALGAALELKRLGCHHVVVHTDDRAIGMRLPAIEGIVIEQRLAKDCTFGLLIDSVCTPQSLALTLNHCERNSTLGLLGTPEGTTTLDLYQVHRHNIKLLGLHELNSEDSQRQHLLEHIHYWLTSHHVELAESVCEIHPSTSFELAYPALLEHSQPFLIHGFDWSTQE